MQTRRLEFYSELMQHRVTAFAFLAVWLVLCTPLFSSPAVAAEETPLQRESMAPPPARDAEGEPPAASGESWNLSADRVSTNHAAGISQAWGNAMLRNGNSSLAADFIEYHRDIGWIYLKGNVHTRLNNVDIYAEEAEFDLESQTGKIHNGTIFMEENAVVLKGKELAKTGPTTFTFGEAELTGCEGPNPVWSIRTSGGEVDQTSYADINDPTFKIKGAPVAWLPMARLPMRAKRQTGFLPPTWGSSSRLGGFYSQPFYWAIDAEQDATFYADYFGKRGVMGGVEYRQVTDSHTKGLWRLDYINDKVTAPTAADQEKQFTSTGLARDNANRYWLRSKYDGWILDPKYEVKLDLDYASDYTYLRTFELGHTKFSNSNSDFVDQFGRSLDTIDSYTRKSTGLISRSWDAEYAMNLKAEYTEDLRYRGGNLSESKDPTVQRLPELSGYVYKQALGNTPFEIQADSSLTYFARNFGTQGGRLDMQPQLSLPLSSAYGSIIPTVGWRETLYNVTDFQNNPAGRSDESQQERHLANFKTTAFSEVFGVYSLDIDPMFQNPEAVFAGNGTLVGLKHAIQPRVDYTRQQYRDQAKLPDFDSLDRIGPVNEVRYSLTNLLNGKRGTITNTESEEGTDTYLAYSYRDLVRHRLEQYYDYNESDRTNDTSEYPVRPFSDVLSQTEFYPLSWLNLTNKIFVSPYGEGITQIENSVGVSDVDYGTLSVGFTQYSKIDEYKRQHRQAINMLTLQGRLHLPYDLSMQGIYQRDIKDGSTVNAGAGLTWHAQCYDVSLYATKTQYDRSLALWVSILGFDTPRFEASSDR